MAYNNSNYVDKDGPLIFGSVAACYAYWVCKCNLYYKGLSLDMGKCEQIKRRKLLTPSPTLAPSTSSESLKSTHGGTNKNIKGLTR